MRTYSPQEMIAKLVAFDTTSRNSNLDLIAFVRDYLETQGAHCDVVPSEDGTKANLYATLGPHEPGGIVLSGHTDVVPIDGQDWVTDPFCLRKKGDRLYGRGTTDMKSFSAIALALVPEFVARGIKTPLHFALSYDEEVGCLGVHSMVDHIITNIPRPLCVIVGEPTSMRVVNGHKGLHAFKTTITGQEAHSSAPQLGGNAILAAAALIHYLSSVAEAFSRETRRGARFDPPYTTINVGTIKGGSAVNIIPKHCSFLWEFRSLPGQDPQVIIDGFETFAQTTVLPKLQQNAPDASIMTELTAVIPTFTPLHGSPAETLTLMLAQQNELHAVSYGTEAGVFQNADIPTIVCGPGDIAQAHQPNEFISIDQVEACEAFLRRLMDHVCV